MNKLTAQLLLVILSSGFLCSEANAQVPADSEIAMAKCTRKVKKPSSSDDDENIGPYDEEYGDGTDVYGDGDGAPSAEDQYQSWGEPLHADPEYYIPETAYEENAVKEEKVTEWKGAAQKAVEKENAYNSINN